MTSKEQRDCDMSDYTEDTIWFDSLEHDRLKEKTTFLEVLLAIISIVAGISASNQSLDGMYTIILGFCIFISIFSNLFLIAVSMSSIRIFKKFQWSLELMYFLLSLSFAAMLPLFFVSSVINRVLLEEYSFVTNQHVSTLITTILNPLISIFVFSYILFTTLVLFGALSSKFADSLCLLSKEHKYWCRCILSFFIIIVLILTIPQNKLLIFFVAVVATLAVAYMIYKSGRGIYTQSITILHNYIESNYIIFIISLICIFSIIILILIHQNILPIPHHDVITNVYIVLDNVSLTYNNTTVNIQNLTLSISNISATYLT